MATAGGITFNNPQWFQFSSLHTQVVQFGFADGSVRPLKAGGSAWLFNTVPSQDWYVFQMLAGMRDGDTFDPSAILIN